MVPGAVCRLRFTDLSHYAGILRNVAITRDSSRHRSIANTRDGAGGYLPGKRAVMPTKMSAMLSGEAARGQTKATAKSDRTRTALAVLFAAAAVLVASFLAVAAGIA